MSDRMLRVEAPHFVAGAVWRKINAQWECIGAAPIIQWMVGNTPEHVKAYLTKKGWTYQWIDLPR